MRREDERDEEGRDKAPGKGGKEVRRAERAMCKEGREGGREG